MLCACACACDLFVSSFIGILLGFQASDLNIACVSFVLLCYHYNFPMVDCQFDVKRNETKIIKFPASQKQKQYVGIPTQSNLSHIFVCSSIRIRKKKTKTFSTKSSLGIRLLLNQQQNVKSYEMDSDHEGHFEWAFGDILRSSPFFSNFVHFFLHSHLTLVSFISEILLFYVQLSLLYSLSIRFIIRYKMLCSMVFSLFIFNGFMFFFSLLWTVVNEVQCFHQNKCTFCKTAIQWFVILFAI